MTNPTIEPEVLTVYQVINEARYIVPIYQRNYAWSKTEIEQLLADIYHQFDIDQHSQFYIGTLTVKAREADLFEIIDGQQRHTTLNLIKAVIANDYHEIGNGNPKHNLSFEARVLSNNYFNQLMNDFDAAVDQVHSEVSIHNLQTGCRDIRRFLKSGYIPQGKLSNYLKYLLHNVRIIRVPVPNGTDLNHYFEIMNSRGEQLEQHEILKAEFIKQLQNYSEETRATFAEIWDACAQMDHHLPFNFDAKRRPVVFGSDFRSVSKEIFEAKKAEYPGTAEVNSDPTQTLLHTLKNHVLSAVDPKRPAEENSRFRSIIDFPNFLLQVLQQFYPDERISFDDKNLLIEFGCTLRKKRHLPNPAAFLNCLFFLRTCFDRYVIKREEGSNDWNWKILQINAANGNLVNTFAEQRELVMIQAMFHVTQPASTYKTWLKPLLSFFNNVPTPESATLVTFLQKQANEQMEKYLEQLDSGTQTPIFCFNLLDFKLWRIYHHNNQELPVTAPMQIEEQVIKLSGVFQSFRFTQNNSVEHVAPQKQWKDEVIVDKIDEFGNLCLISQSSNSRLLNLPFPVKKNYFINDKRKSVESLKQAIIFSYPKWGDQEIEEHGSLMKKLLKDTAC